MRRKGISPGSPEAYLFALVCAGIAAAIGFAFSYFIDDITLSIAFYPAIFIAALIGGIHSGITVVLISMSMEWWADDQFFGDPKAALRCMSTLKSTTSASYAKCSLFNRPVGWLHRDR